MARIEPCITLKSGRSAVFRLRSVAHSLLALSWVSGDDASDDSIAGTVKRLQRYAAVIGVHWANDGRPAPPSDWYATPGEVYGEGVLDWLTDEGYTLDDIAEMTSFLVPLIAARVPQEPDVAAKVAFSEPPTAL